MSRMSELSMMLDELITCGTKLADTARALKEFYSSDAPEQPAPEKKTSAKKPGKETGIPCGISGSGSETGTCKGIFQGRCPQNPRRKSK